MFPNEQDKVRVTLVKTANAIYLLMFLWILVIAGGCLVEASPWIVIFLPIVLYMIYRLSLGRPIWDNRFSYDILWGILFLLSTVLIFLLGYQLKVDFSWDWGTLIRLASDYVLDGEFKNNKYLARYDNNQCWFACLVVLFKIIHFFFPGVTLEHFHTISIGISCGMVVLSIFLIHRIARLVWGSRKALFVGILTILCAPFYLYATFAYTDTSGMLVCSLLIYLFVKAERCDLRGRVFCLVVLGILASFSLHLKVTVFIVFIAMVISFLLRVRSWKKLLLSILVVVLMIGGSYTLMDKGIGQIAQISEKTSEKHKFPLTHWVMMSLQYGGYVQEDVDFTKSFPTYEEKKEANITEIKKRVKEKGFWGMTKHVCYDKVLRVWGNASLSGSEYIARSPEDPDGMWQHLMMFNGKWNGIFLFYTCLYHGIMIIGLVLSGLGTWKKKVHEQPMLFARIALLGITLFLMIWECNARYLVTYLPILMLVTAEGYFTFRQRIHEKRAR